MTEQTQISKESPDAVRAMVREGYGKVAQAEASCCQPTCCGPDQVSPPSVRETASRIGYSDEELDLVPESANLGLGCGNPTALAALQPGEVVVDLGAGAGMDAFIAARQVGPAGRVIGVDMTPEMLLRARTAAVEEGLAQTVEFREGIIEALPVASESVDVVISNCVINLSPDKPAAFSEAFRVLKPGGRLAVSDIVLSEPLPPEMASAAAAWIGCVAGAALADDYLAAIEGAGFTDLQTTRVSAAPMLAGFASDPIAQQLIASVGMDRVMKAAATVWSYKIEARKP